ncbi:uncharacterized protein ARMOST_22003 [Armillaria ostoyae]|uniref:Uncharacterized protein n=1 Tax=Armillaria ostoyae TaxID=47428 RepID=A0A284SBN5_ARMOS|nr:uncharacterized protein ARMOST_22003 [Armillaria ostoyae]
MEIFNVSSSTTSENFCSEIYAFLDSSAPDGARNIAQLALEFSNSAERPHFDGVIVINACSCSVRDKVNGTGKDVQSRPTKLLYMIGDKNRDTLPSILGGPGILLHSSNS